jgi:transcription elongation factor GreA
MANYLTKEGLEKLKKELKELETTKRKEVSEKIRHTASQGDLSENAGYDAAKEEQGFLEGRIRELRQIIAEAKIVEKKGNNDIQIGSSVVLESGGKKEEFQLVGPEEADIFQKKISFKSPLGDALLGKKKGDKIKIDIPDGKKEYKVMDIE